MSTNSECSNLCCPNYDVVAAGSLKAGNNMAPLYRVTAGQYETLTHRVDPMSSAFTTRDPVQLSPGEMGSCGYNSIFQQLGLLPQSWKGTETHQYEMIMIAGCLFKFLYLLKV